MGSQTSPQRVCTLSLSLTLTLSLARMHVHNHSNFSHSKAANHTAYITMQYAEAGKDACTVASYARQSLLSSQYSHRKDRKKIAFYLKLEYEYELPECIWVIHSGLAFACYPFLVWLLNITSFFCLANTANLHTRTGLVKNIFVNKCEFWILFLDTIWDFQGSNGKIEGVEPPPDSPYFAHWI